VSSTYHWYIGDPPPFTGVAEKVTGTPAQTELALGAIVTEGFTTAIRLTLTLPVMLAEQVVDGFTATTL
jgi:hypothetical protein